MLGIAKKTFGALRLNCPPKTLLQLYATAYIHVHPVHVNCVIYIWYSQIYVCEYQMCIMCTQCTCTVWFHLIFADMPMWISYVHYVHPVHVYVVMYIWYSKIHMICEYTMWLYVLLYWMSLSLSYRMRAVNMLLVCGTELPCVLHLTLNSFLLTRTPLNSSRFVSSFFSIYFRKT